MLDLLVIGAGLSGLTASIYAAQAGLSVRVITKGMSALHWAAGSIDLLGYLPHDTHKDTPVDMPLSALEQLPASHPLRQVETNALRQTLADLQSWLDAAELPYAGGEDDANLWLPSAVGARRPTYLAPLAQAAARLDHDAPLLIVGFDRLRDFYPALLADNLKRQGHAARARLLPLSLLTDRHDANNVHLAAAFEEDRRAEAITDALRPHIMAGERVAFPAILGLTRHREVVAKLASALNAPIAEIPTLPPSVTGIRLHQALVHTLAKHGGRVESNMAAIDFDATAKSINWVASAASARPLRHRARAYLLATGGILGGGFNSDPSGRSWETVFNLPLTLPTDRGAWFRPEFLDAAGHPVFQGGVQVNAAWQPVDAQGEVIYTNLWAAGNLLAHADAIRTRSHEGLALATGAAAAKKIREMT